MTFSLIILGVLLILVSFNVFEDLMKSLNVSKRMLIALILVSVVLFFVPNILINNVYYSLVGFLLPIVFCFLILINTKKLKRFAMIFVGTLLSFTTGIVYNLITFDVYDTNILQPYIAVGVALGVVLYFVTHSVKRAYVACFLGVVLSDIVFYLSRYSIYGEYYLTVGNEKILAITISVFLTALITKCLYVKAKTIVYNHKYKEINNRKQVN